MQPIATALSEVKMRIPNQILREVFTDKSYNYRQVPVSIDEQMLNKVVRPRVLVLANIVGGTEVNVSLEGISPQPIDTYTAVYHIPKSRTNGCSIMSVLSIGYNNMNMQNTMSVLGSTNPYSITPVSMAQMAVQDSFSAIPSVSTARVELVGENMVVVKDLSNYASGTYLRCIIANDENLSNIKMRSIMAFCKMVELAIKSYIYNEYIITMDQAQLSGGQDLGRFKEIIEGYADSEELLQTFVLEKWQKIALMNDNTQMTRFLKLQIGSMK